jgi:hypothetical protein
LSCGPRMWSIWHLLLPTDKKSIYSSFSQADSVLFGTHAINFLVLILRSYAKIAYYLT